MGFFRSVFFVCLFLFEMVVSKSVERVYSPTKNDQLVKRLDSTVSWKSLENAYFITQLLSSSDHIFDPNVQLVT